MHESDVLGISRTSTELLMTTCLGRVGTELAEALPLLLSSALRFSEGSERVGEKLNARESGKLPLRILCFSRSSNLVIGRMR